MNMFGKIRNGQLTREEFERSLAGYKTDKVILQRNAGKFGPELFQSKLREIEMSISMCELFIEKFEEISKDLKVKPRLIK